MNTRVSVWRMFSEAASGLHDNARRSILSLLGVSIGVAAVVMVDSLARGAHEFVYAELETFGLRTVWISRAPHNNDPERSVRLGSGIKNADFAIIRAGCCPSVSLVSPLISSRGKSELTKTLAALPIRNGNRFSNALMEGVSEDYLAIAGDSLAAGRNLSAREISGAHQVAVLGKRAAKDLFGDEHAALGRYFRIGEHRFVVIGIMNEKNRDILISFGIRDDNNRVVIPYTAYQRIIGNDEIGRLQLQATSAEDAHLAMQQVIALLEQRHRKRYSYIGDVMSDHKRTADRILRAITVLGIISALMLLCVGGLGTMNMMYTAVIERTREIGLRKAVGARSRDIHRQFLFEAVLISGTGGLCGLALGAAGALSLSLGSGFPLSLSWTGIIAAFACAITIGVLSGLLPAHRAATLQPVLALRFE